MRYEALFVDTWGWMALGHRQEPRHQEVRRIYRDLRNTQVPINTSDFVLDEFITLLFRRETYDEAVRFVEGILASAASAQVLIERVTPDRFFAAWQLRKRFQDKPWNSFTDLTSMVIMDELSVHRALTEDEHFTRVGMGFIRVP